MTEIGAPTTAAVTAAKPATGSKYGTVTMSLDANAHKLIAAAPIIAAGENTPPNKPKLIHNDVAKSLRTNNKNKN